MRELWVGPNRRALLLGMVPPVLFALVGATVILFGRGRDFPAWVEWFAGSVMLFAMVPAVVLVYYVRKPRLAYEAGELLVFLTAFEPIRVPVDVVECFFLGQGPTEVPALKKASAEAKNLVVRLAERAKEWKRVEVKPILGQWCDGYITIRGAWCEPITQDLVERLNGRLVEAHRQQREMTENKEGVA